MFLSIIYSKLNCKKKKKKKKKNVVRSILKQTANLHYL